MRFEQVPAKRLHRHRHRKFAFKGHLLCYRPCCVVIAEAAIVDVVAVGYLVAVYIIKSHASLIQNVVTCNMTS